MQRPVIPAELVAPIYNPHTFRDRKAVDEVFRRLRAEHPLSIAEMPGYDPHWIVTKYADVREISRQDNLFRSAERPKFLSSQMAEKMMRDFSGGYPNVFRTLVQMDDPEHAAYRNVTSHLFMPQAVQDYTPFAQDLAKQYVDKLAALAPACDFAKEVAFLYPLEVILTLLGIPKQDHPMMLRFTQWLFNYADPDLMRPGADPNNPDEFFKTWGIVYDEWSKYFLALAENRRACPREDVATVIANGKVDGCPMQERAMVSYFAIACSAGHDTTAATTGMAMWVLAERPDLLKKLQENPRLIAGFVEEAIRWTSPIQQFVRSAAVDYELRGRQIKKGDLLYLSYVSANKDEEQFEDAFTFKPERSPNRHIGLGYGTHICLGQHLARLEMKALWEELIPRLESVEMAGEGAMAESEFVCGPKTVPIRFKFKN